LTEEDQNHQTNNGEMPAEEIQAGSELRIRVPASCANLGPGFETLALAVELYTNISVKVQAPRKGGDGPEIITVGPIAGKLPINNTNLIAKVMEQLWSQNKSMLSCLQVKIETDIPLDAGLGSSAAATAAAVTATLALTGQQLEKGKIFEHTARIEGHADSAAATIFGGFTLCAPNLVPGDVLPRKLMWPEKWSLIAVVPPYTITGNKSRTALPASVSHKDAVANVQRAALLIEAVAAADDEAMKAALRDKLHEPYRAKFIPELAEIKKLLQDFDVLGSVISGSGPSVLTILDGSHKDEVFAELKKWSDGRKNPCTILELPVDNRGIVIDC
jgi:homoserine kinase